MLEIEINNICPRLFSTQSNHWSYERDAEIIKDGIISEMKAASSEFESLYRGTYVTGSYVDDLKIRKPHEFDYFIKLVLPVAVIPEQLVKNPGLIRLRVKDACSFAENGYVQRHRVQTWLRDILKKIFMSGISMRTTGGQYKLKYVPEDHNVVHTIEAAHGQNSNRKISFDFVPVFEFSEFSWCLSRKLQNCDSSWFAVPLKRRRRQYDQAAFKVCAPHWEGKILANKKKLKNSLRLIKVVRDTTDMLQLTSYMLKTMFLIELERANDEFWQKPLGEITLQMLRQLKKYLIDGNVPFYWDCNHNLLRYIETSTRREYVEKVEYAITVLGGSTYNRKRLWELFGLHCPKL